MHRLIFYDEAIFVVKNLAAVSGKFKSNAKIAVFATSTGKKFIVPIYPLQELYWKAGVLTKNPPTSNGYVFIVSLSGHSSVRIFGFVARNLIVLDDDFRNLIVRTAGPGRR